MRWSKLLIGTFALTLTLILNSLAYAASKSNVECRVYDPTKRCVWVYKSNPYPIAYVDPKKAIARSYRKRRGYARHTVGHNSVMSPLPVLTNTMIPEIQKPQQVSSLPVPPAEHVYIEGIPRQHILPIESKTTKPVQEAKIVAVKVTSPKKESLTSRVEINEVIKPEESQQEKMVASVKITALKTDKNDSSKTQLNHEKQKHDDRVKPHYSWVSINSESYSQQIADILAEFVNQQKTNEHAMLLIEPALQTNNKITPLLMQKLRSMGYNIASEQAQFLNACKIRYVVDETEGGILVRIKVDDMDAARWFVMDQSKTTLLAVSAFSVKRGD